MGISSGAAFESSTLELLVESLGSFARLDRPFHSSRLLSGDGGSGVSAWPCVPSQTLNPEERGITCEDNGFCPGRLGWLVVLRVILRYFAWQVPTLASKSSEGQRVKTETKRVLSTAIAPL